MRYILLGTITGCLFLASSAFAQSTFWGFDENNKEVYIPAQCDGQFDETHGGVFMPTPQELYEQGEALLLEKDNTRSGAGYCLLSAAIQGNVPAQLRVAQLYNKGIVLPQNDIAAYRWAFLASLNGNKEAEQLALTLEQLLTSEEIQMATRPLESMLPGLKEEKTTALKEQEDTLEEKKKELEELNKEIDDLLGVSYQPPKMKTIEEIREKAKKQLEEKEDASADETTSATKTIIESKPAPQPATGHRRRRTSSNVPAANKNGTIFNEKDRFN